jgi:hypothetical protein
MMLEALRTNKARAQTAKSKSIPAPVKGWVAMNNKALGVPGTALILENFFPKADTVELRAGWDEHSDTTETVPVNTLMAYHGTSANKLFGVCNDTIYDVTGSSGTASSVTTLTSSKCVHVNFSTSGGHFLFVVNGSDTAKHYDGSSWATPSITGTTSDNFSHVNVFKSRLYFVVKNSLKFAYLPTGSIAGAASTYELGDIFPRGGTLVATGTYTGDGGAGADDHFVAVTSEGQVAFFAGSDPGDANAWNMIGVFDVARPLGNRCLVKVGGDLYILTEIGIIPLSQALKTDPAALGTVAVTANIAPEINQAARRYKDNYGWQVIAYPKGTMAIVNVPISEGVSQVQYVMNSQTGAWCKFTNINAACFEVMGGALYFGGNDGKVYQAFEAASDGGSDIIGDMLLAYDDFGYKAQLKHWKMIRPVIYSQANVTPQIGLNVDYIEAVPTGTITAGSTSNFLWGSMTWGSFTWSGGLSLNARWRPVTDRPGYVAGVRMRVAASGQGSPILLQVNEFNVTYQVGGIM